MTDINHLRNKYKELVSDKYDHLQYSLSYPKNSFIGLFLLNANLSIKKHSDFNLKCLSYITSGDIMKVEPLNKGYVENKQHLKDFASEIKNFLENINDRQRKIITFLIEENI